jgi:carboxypeptidase family protein
MLRSRLIIATSIIAVILTTTASSQTFRGGISGSVVDSSGATIAGATLQLVNEGTGLARNQETTSAGEFNFPDLQVGLYTLSVTKQGFQTRKHEKVEVAVGKVTSLLITLAIGQTSETVEVQAAAATLETQSTTLNAVVNQRAVQEIPLNGRDFRTLLYLTPGYNQSGSMNGNRGNQNNWQIDGTDNNDFWHNGEAVNQGSISGIAGVLLPIESIDQFNQQAAGSGEFGRNPGSQVNVALKSGTNEFHGSAYYFNRNEAFALQSPFVPVGAPDKLRNEHYGFSLGGPILKNRTFFFINYEKQTYVIADPVRGTVPSNAWIDVARGILQKYNVPVNPVMLATFQNLWPARGATAPATRLNFSSGDDDTGHSNNGVIKIDQQIGEKHTISARAFLGTGEAAQFAGSVYREYYQVVPSRQHNFAVIWNSTWTPRLVNQLLAGVNYFNQTFDDAVHAANPPSWGLNTGVTNPSNFGSPTITLNGFNNGLVGATPRLGRIDVTGHLTDNLSYNFGSHALKFGGEFRRAKLDVFYYREARGSFNFDGNQGPWRGDPTLDTAVDPLGTQKKAMADFLAGIIAAGSASIAVGDPQRDYFVNSIEGWAQDNWQMSPRLNINYGVRYTYNGRFHAVGSKPIAIFDPKAAGGLSIVGQDIDALYPADYNNLAPRFGFAYAPWRGGNLVVRGHYGVYYDIVNGNLFIDNRAGSDAGRGISRQPTGPAPVFTASNPGTGPSGNGPYTIQAGVPIFGGATPRPPFAVFTVNQNLRSPYVQNFGLDAQFQVTRNALLTVGYVGNQARKLVYDHNINQIRPSAAAAANARRPFFAQFPQFSGITEIETAANSSYNALQVSLRTSNWHNLSSQFSYTLGHAIDEISAPRNVQPTDNYNRKFDRGNASFDYRHVFSGYVLYDVPQLRKGPPALTKGWQVNAFITADSGTPFTVLAGVDQSHTRNGADRVDQKGDPFAGLTQPPTVNGRFVNGIQYYNPAAFALPAPGSYGSIERNAFYGPGFASVDLSVFKNFKIKERYSIQFRSEIFNIFNRLNMGNPDGSISGGLISGTRHGGDAPGIGYGEPRNIQFVLKFLF